MIPLFKISVLEIFAGIGWVCLAALVLVMWVAFPLAFGAEGEGAWISRGQGAAMGVFISGCYSVLLAARIGGAQVSRGANLYYRGCGFGELGRWFGISAACSLPLLLSLLIGGGLLCFTHWAWTGSVWGSVLSVLQFTCLALVLFSIIIMPTVGAGAKFGETAGSIFGLVFLFFGMFFPPFFSIAVRENPGLEFFWCLLPHLYALDWSPAVTNIWDPSSLGVFLPALGYGLLLMVGAGAGGYLLFSYSNDSND